MELAMRNHETIFPPLLILLLAVLSACHTPTAIRKSEHAIQREAHTHRAADSVLLRDTVHVVIRGDTVRIKQTVWRERIRTVQHTDTVFHTDTVYISEDVVRQHVKGSARQQLKLLFGAVVALLLFVGGFRILRFVRAFFR